MSGETDRLLPAAARAVRAAIALAGGREVCFACTMDAEGRVSTARVVARGDVSSVLALPGFAQRGELLLHNHPSGVLEPSGPDLEIAARMHEGGIGFAIVDNEATRLYVVVEVPRTSAPAEIDPADVSALLGPEGPIAAALGRYEDRPGQRALSSAIARLFTRNGIGLLEAGTGVGKSLAYLVPALRWAAASGERTVVSTNTITLQEQLIAKDLPFLASALTDQPVRFVMLKGWRNYLCLLRLEQAQAQAATLFATDESAELSRLDVWAGRTTDGSLSDLPVAPRREVWDEVAAEGDLCTRLRCPHFERCFVFKARRAAAEADIVVVNHHLLLADVAVRRASGNWTDAAVLPAYKRLVVDEGHHLEDAAAAHLGQTATRIGLNRLFARMERKGRGLLPALERSLASQSDLLAVASLDLVRERITPAVDRARAKSEQLFALLDDWMTAGSHTTARLTEQFEEDPIWRAGLTVELDDLLLALEEMSEGLRLIRERFETDEKRAEEMAPLLNEVRAVTRRMQGAGDALRAALRPGRSAANHVRWIERRKGERNLGAASVPLDLAPILREDLFERIETAVITSATLAVGDDFSFVRQRLGLTEETVEPTVEQFPSPFDFARQALLVVPSDFPAPNSDAAGHLRRTITAAADLVEASGGGVFLLFTSHRDVREAADALRALGLDARFPLLVHGDAPRDVLLDRFRAHGNAVLIGTATFWEGIDVPGEALRALLLARIPFRVPTEPVTAAQCEAIGAAGGDPFGEYMVPHAALRLKQGFGRLIRSTTDRGVVVLCDPRVVQKGYGKTLLAALPPATRLVAPWAELRPRLTEFYQQRPDLLP
ncbi:MAG: hypothetical protein K2X99_02605 [Gemmatimonadaceae bacterium]|nr:hypothetical protein [Gemmatimonadaceae bacterium]